jgi:hypothetical protein
LQNPIEFSLDSGDVSQEQQKLMQIRRRNWEKDYFTSALPSPQKGVAVKIPVESSGIVELDNPDNRGGYFQKVDKSAFYPTLEQNLQIDPIPPTFTSAYTRTSLDQNRVVYDPNGTLNVKGESSFSINDWRKSWMLQKFFERNQRSGSRYTEFILSHFGVHTKDSRLQRPEYLGGGRNPVMISEVLQQSGVQIDPASGDPIGTPQANMAEHGLGLGNSHQFKRSFSEHGFIIGIMSIIPKLSYMQNLDKMWTREDPLEYFFS